MFDSLFHLIIFLFKIYPKLISHIYCESLHECSGRIGLIFSILMSLLLKELFLSLIGNISGRSSSVMDC
jgi:hypothetical protein